MRGTMADHYETREWVTMKNGGQQIFGILHRPQMPTNPPVVLILHGFASSKHGSNRCYVALAERLAKEGFATLRFDFRGAGDSEGSLTEITLEDLISDALSVIEGLETLQGIDASRVALFGASLGGTISILAAARIQTIKTLVLWAPVASGELWYRDFLTQHPEYVHADPEKVLSSYSGVRLHPLFREQFAQMTAYKTLKQQLSSLPTLHMHGEKDVVISISHQEAFRQACGQCPYMRFIKYQDGEHSLGFSPNFTEVVEETLSWLQKHL
jgi:alpha-beta hydrolase superfamily lysophospholipase